MKLSRKLRLPMAIVGSVALATVAAPAALAQHNGSTKPHLRLLMPVMDSERGMYLFIEKGCFKCHEVNGVGGEDAAALDAHTMEDYMNPFDTAAKMWQMAPIMIAAQEEELGAQIEFTGDELADIIAFLHDDEQQHEFTIDLLSPEQRELLHEHGEEGDQDEDHEHGSGSN